MSNSERNGGKKLVFIIRKIDIEGRIVGLFYSRLIYSSAKMHPMIANRYGAEIEALRGADWP